MGCGHEDFPCCGCGHDEITSEDNCCPICGEPDCFGNCDDENYDYDRDDSMDGDFDSGMASAGFGTDEDYNHYDYGEDF
jgi:hypothetical protein